MLAGLALGVLGLLCIVSGVTLLAWRMLEPNAAVLIPPGFVGTPVDTPTPGVLGTALAIPPLPDLATPTGHPPIARPGHPDCNLAGQRAPYAHSVTDRPLNGRAGAPKPTTTRKPFSDANPNAAFFALTFRNCACPNADNSDRHANRRTAHRNLRDHHRA